MQSLIEFFISNITKLSKKLTDIVKQKNDVLKNV